MYLSGSKNSDCEKNDPNASFKIGGLKNKKVSYRLPILLHKEDKQFIAECPLFFVAGNGYTIAEAIKDVTQALITYLSDIDVQKGLPDEISYTKEEMIKKAEDLFREYSDPDEVPPKYEYHRICVSFYVNEI